MARKHDETKTPQRREAAKRHRALQTVEMNPPPENHEAGAKPPGLKEKASQTIDRALHSKPITVTIESLSGAGQALAASGRSALQSGRSLLGGLLDLSVVLGLASGVGVWWLMHEMSSSEGDVEIKSAERPNLMNRVQDKGSQLLDTVSESATQVSSGAMQKIQSGLGELQVALNKNPMAYLAGGLLVGGLLAILLPQSEMEGRMLGSARERVVDTAEGALKAGIHLVEGEAVGTAISTVAEKLT